MPRTAVNQKHITTVTVAIASYLAKLNILKVLTCNYMFSKMLTSKHIKLHLIVS